MIRNAIALRNLSLVIKLLMTCVVVAYSSHVGFAASPDVQLLVAKAEKGYVNQEIELAQAYFTGEGVAQDAKQAAYWYEKAAQSGNPEAQNLVGYLYEMGMGVPADAGRALHWYQLSAASGLSDASLNLGVLYALGLGVKKDEARAAEYFEEAVHRGNGSGAAYLGTIYYSGMGVKQDRAAAEHWYAIGQKMHDPISAFDLGMLYATIPEHPHVLPKAAGFLRQSASTGYVPAMHSLALLLIQHPELAKSRQEVQFLLESAANAGSWRSSLLLGVVTRDGNGVPADSKAAYYHFKVAALQGGAQAEPLVAFDLHRLTETLGSEETQALDSEAASWFQQHHAKPAFVRIRGSHPKFFSDPTHPDPAELLHAGLLLSDAAS